MSLNKNFLLISFCAAIVLSGFSCGREEVQLSPKNESKNENNWYKQAQVDLGARIKMLSPDKGFAMSRGRGNIEGYLYYFSNGNWEPIYSFPYSDFPIMAVYDSNKIFTINHLTHNGNYRPVFSSFENYQREEKYLPRVMWDKTDYLMWKGISVQKDGSAWMVGQQGRIMYFNKKYWKQIENPVNSKHLNNLLSGDLNDVKVFENNSGWAVGKDGKILHLRNGKWEDYPSPVKNDLIKLSFADKNNGWAAGANGTIIFYNGRNWKKQFIPITDNFRTIKALDKNHVWAAGENSSLYFYNGKIWREDKSIKIFDDTFDDLDVIKEKNNYLIWLIGNDGIYTNSQSMGFSFTDYTNQLSLRRDGRAGIFFNVRDKDYPDLLVENEDGPALLFKNENGKFSDDSRDAGLADSPEAIAAVAVADINNDGYNDILLIKNQFKYKLYLGTFSDTFKDFTTESNLILEARENSNIQSAQFVDFDNDGNLDLYIANYEGEDVFYKNNGAGNFLDVTSVTGNLKPLNAQSYGATLGDFNKDGLTDLLYVYHVPIKNKEMELFINEGNFHFRQNKNPEFLVKSDASNAAMVAAADDFNNDGNTDIIVMNQKSEPWLLLNNGNASFTNVSKAFGLQKNISHPAPSGGILNTADVNNDGYEDIFISSKLFINEKGKSFREVSRQVGLNFLGNPSFADIDNDGDVDLYIGSSRQSLGKGERSIFYRNNLNNNNFIKVKVFGDESNRNAIGAKVYIEAFKQGKQIYTQLKTVGLGATPLVNKNISELHFGAKPDYTYNIKVIFPSGIMRIKNNIKTGSLISFYESSFLESGFIRSKKSIIRSLILFKPQKRIFNFIYLFIIVALLVYYGIEAGAKKIVKAWYFIPALIIVYFLIVHFTILNNEAVKTFSPLIGVVAIGFGWIYTAGKIIRKNEAKFISHFKIEELIGEGGMGKVYKAFDINSKKTVAVKILNEELLKDDQNKKRFSSEGRLLSGFNHPNIIKVYETGEAAGKGFIAMEYLPGGTLKKYLVENFPLKNSEVMKFALQICGGLHEIHKKEIIHRDIKTNNILLNYNNEAVIMDFGLSKSTLVTTMTSLGTIIGTLGYVAPEQITNVYIDSRTDIFSFGVVIYELLTNRIPFKGENEIALIHSIFNTVPEPPSLFNQSVTAELELVVEKCLAKDPAERYADVTKIITDLKTIKV